MPLLEALRLALLQIRVQKLKSGFTVLGVTIGVMFLIGIVSVIEGMGKYMRDNVAGKLMTVNGFEVHSQPTFEVGSVDEETETAYHRRPPLYERDTAAIFAALPQGFLHTVENSTILPISTRDTKPHPVLTQSVTPDYFTIKDVQLTEGRPFVEQENAQHAPVAVIGQDVKARFFPNTDPIGRTLKISGVPYRVVGVAEPQGSILGISFDAFVIIPYSAPASRFASGASGELSGIIIQGPNPTAQIIGEEAVRQILRTIHKLHPTQPDDFTIETPNRAFAFWGKIQTYLILAGVILPAIGLLVGAIVIMNIMLMAVAERTREIGIRKSLGATHRDILWQFLIESATLSTFGAAVGIGIGISLAELLTKVTPLPASVAPWSIFVSLALGTGIGIIAGVYPASRAARLDPIVALHAE